MNEDQFRKEILRRLDVLISLHLDNPPPERSSSIANKVHRLMSLGLAPGEVASVIGKPVNYVTAILATKESR
ncbi:MAG: hypothetical protein ACE5JQ_15900 [Candidatus Methylomirabilales bacterium]